MAYTTYAGTITGARTRHTESQTGVDQYSSWYTGSAITNAYNIGSGTVREPTNLGSVYNYVYYRVNVNPKGGVIKNVVVKGYANLPIGEGRSSSHIAVKLTGSSGAAISGSTYQVKNTDFSGEVTYNVPVSSGGDFLTSGTIYVDVSDIDRNYPTAGSSTFRITSIQIQVAPPDLSLSLSPASAIAGDTVTASVTGRYNRTLNLTFSANNVTLSTTTMTTDTKSVATQASWFDTASVTGNTMTATVTVTDPTDDRTAETTIQLTRPQPLSVTATAPKSTTVEGGESITFAWSVSGTYGTQNQATLEYSSDNANWSALGSVSGSGTTLTKSSKFFAPGTVYWRVTVRSTYGLYTTSSTVNFTARYSATSYVAPLNSPTGGNVNATEPITFSCTLRTDGVPYQPFTVSAATFYWRSRSTNPYTQVSMTPDGANASVTISANTFPTGSIDWYISATDNLGATTQTDVYTISTLASAIDAQPVSPVNTVEISNNDIEFVWRFASTRGDPQNGAELQYSLDGSTWTQLASAQGTATSVIVPANTFHAGTVYWRVRAFNGVGDSGEWSSVAQFVAYGAPEAPSVIVDAVPFATIRWQSDGQVSYEVEVDGKAYGPFLGTEKAYQLYDYLEDGSHKARVRVLGEAGLWSLWGETLFDIANVPTSTITLRAKTDVDTELTWTGGSGNYYVYRDRKQIAKTNGHSFADRTVLGVHEYRVVERLASGNYNASNLLTRTMEVEYMHVAALEGGNWVEILHTLKSQSDPFYTYNAETESVHQDQSEFPVVSIGPYLDESASYSAVFLYTEPDEHRRFRALFRKPVILKTTDGVVMIGVLNAWERSPKTSRAKQYYTAYTFNLQRIDWEDFIDDTT